jgi:peroxiredoxin
MARQLGLAGDLAIPSTFVLDEEGIVRWAYVGENIEDRPSAKQILEALEALKQEA